ncbi:MAG: ATP synthase F0 subunit B [Bdellovibrionales bacterium]|nr:ATP synthase F0 subunit B [Bdellovibrionales bacterium]
MQGLYDTLAMFDLKPGDGLMIPIGVVLFVILWQFLDKYLFLPYVRLVEAREAATTGSVSSARDVVERTQAVKAECEEKLRRARVAAMETKLTQLREAKQKASEIIRASEDSAKTEIQALRDTLSSEMSAMRNDIQKQAELLAEAIVEKVQAPPKLAQKSFIN